MRIERANGPTNPGSTPAGWTLLQDDSIFHAATVSMGTFGVCLGFTLKLVDEYFLAENTRLTTWEKERGALPAFAEQGRHAELYINPYDRVSGDQHRALRIIRTQRRRKPTRSVVIDRSRPKMRVKLRQADEVAARAHRSAKGRFRARLAVGLALRFLRADKGQVRGPWWEILRRDSFTCGHGFEVFIPLEHANKGGTALLSAIEHASKFQGPGVKLEDAVVATGPIGMRFIASGEHQMSMTYARYLDDGQVRSTTCWVSFEVPRLYGTPNIGAIPRAIAEALVHAAVPFRCHWGQYTPWEVPEVKDVASRYPDFQAWNALRKQFDPDSRFLTPKMRALLP